MRDAGTALCAAIILSTLGAYPAQSVCGASELCMEPVFIAAKNVVRRTLVALVPTVGRIIGDGIANNTVNVCQEL